MLGPVNLSVEKSLDTTAPESKIGQGRRGKGSGPTNCWRGGRCLRQDPSQPPECATAPGPSLDNRRFCYHMAATPPQESYVVLLRFTLSPASERRGREGAARHGHGHVMHHGHRRPAHGWSHRWSLHILTLHNTPPTPRNATWRGGNLQREKWKKTITPELRTGRKGEGR